MLELSYPYDSHPKPGDSVEIAPGVRWITMPMGGSLNHINLYLLEDSDGWFVVDTGLADPRTLEIWQDVFRTELGGKQVKGVFCTHMHPDHTGQARAITDQFRCPLYMTQAEYFQARAFGGSGGSHHSSWLGELFYRRAGMPGEYMEQLARMWAHRSSQSMSMGEMPSGFIRMQDGEEMRIGGRDWRVVVGSGHSPEHMSLYCHELGILISGDQILPVITSNVSVHPTEPEANPLRNWMESIDKFLRTPEETLILPAHNLPFHGVRVRLRQLMDHHEDRMLAVEKACVEPQVARDLLPVLFSRQLDARQTMMALGEAIAHLHLLMYRNRIARSLHEDGRYRFTSIDPNLSRRMHPLEAPSERPELV
ncbi:MAG: MBL fold metallo-hydrolase [Pseudomonadales bacterium]|nr:MBL fold metallo-hydrolase [Pseudomonadales bacterium]